MTHPFFFGYGSLVNLNTHTYPHASPATARGWRRAWVQTDLRKLAFLTAIPKQSSEITGMIAGVPDADWDALDLREKAYERLDGTHEINHTRADSPEVAIYAISSDNRRPVSGEHPILLSYLDVVVQGYLQEFGEAGALDFMDSTDGWEAPILDDRADPIYPRAQNLTLDEMLLVDDFLDGIGSNRITA